MCGRRPSFMGCCVGRAASATRFPATLRDIMACTGIPCTAAACMRLKYTYISLFYDHESLTQSSCRFRSRFAVSPTVARSPAAAGTFINSTRAGRSSEQPIRCPFSNSRFTVELSRANHRRGRYCWTIKETAGEGNRCPRGRFAQNKCCAETPEAFVLRNIGKG